MIKIRRASERGHVDHGWLQARHSFSFSDYYDPEWMGFRALRVINEDTVAPGQGFGTHPHRDMEIITYPLAGAVEHSDSMGNGSVVRAGEIQYMCAGTGVEHSERNPSREPLHLLQIWIVPDRKGHTPSYAQQTVDLTPGRWRLLVSSDGAEGSVKIHQDARLFAARLGNGQELAHGFAPGRHGWLQLARGSVELGTARSGERLGAGDGVAVSGESEIRIRAVGDAEVLLFDLP